MPSSETPAAPLTPSPKLAGAGRRGIQFLLDYLSIVIVSGASLALFLLLPTNDDGSIEGGATVIAIMLIVALVSIGWTCGSGAGVHSGTVARPTP